MREHKMTEWDAGQELISCCDHMREVEESLEQGGFQELAKTVKSKRIEIAKAFNQLNSHEFKLGE